MHCETRQGTKPDRWYVAYTEPRRETVAREHMERQGYETYLPMHGRIEPMFPRYLFFRPATSSQSIAPVRSTRGVQAVVRFGSVYAQVRPELIAAVKEQEALHKHRPPGAPLPRPGQRVRVQANAVALAGLEGLVHASATRRVVVLMEILGRQTPVRLPAETLEVI